jgi:acyl transferase domain-containing protein
MSFAPVAVIGRACLMPGANTPETLWENTLNKKDSLMTVPDNTWNVSFDQLNGLEDKIASTRGGYILDFERQFTSDGYLVTSEEILKQDTLTKWLLSAGRSALQDATYVNHAILQQCGVIMGNLSYPTLELSTYAQSVWCQKPTENPHHRFMSGYPVMTMAHYLGLQKNAYALDAACASSLYAIKLACDELHSQRAHMMLAGGINCADDLYLHMGFTALQALSQSGQSRPFHQEADGLVPAQGCAIVVLKLLESALKDNDKIYGVIRGIGLSNDGAQKGFLAPSIEGQVRAMKKAYQLAGIDPKEISWVDCHATGTKLGDQVEMESMRQIFPPSKNIALGTLKANIGHTITASGAAALINVLSGFEHQLKIPSMISKQEAIDCPFELLESPQEWRSSKIAAINSFGFGGNNAHLIVEDFNKTNHAKKFYISNNPQKKNNTEYAVTAVHLRVGNVNSLDKFKDIILSGKNENSYNPKITTIKLPIQSTKFPPADLQNTLGQQLILLELMHECYSSHPALLIETENTGVYVGMQTEPDIARYSVKWRLGESVSAIMPKLTASHVLGCMPNIVTNRLNNQYDFKGPSFSVSQEENSGLQALHIGIQALKNNELDTIVIGAVDLSCEPVHSEAVAKLYPPDKHQPCDAAVVLVIKRLKDAILANDTIYSIFTEEDIQNKHKFNQLNTQKLFGYSHSTQGLLNFVSDACAHRPLNINELKTKTKTKQKISHTEEPPKLAFVFTGSQTSYPKMGAGLFNQFLTQNDLHKHQSIINKINSFQRMSDLTQLDELMFSSFLSRVHAKISREYFGLVPDVCLGYCAGETNALFAMGVWSSQETLYQDLYQSGLYHDILTGKFSVLQAYNIKNWQSIRIMAPIKIVRELCEKSVYVSIVNTPHDCVISGELENCDKTVQKILSYFPTAGIKKLPFSLVIHCPEFSSEAQTWKKIHTRKTNETIKNFCLYSAGADHLIKNRRDEIANALTQQALSFVNFPDIVERAWNDGVRIFIEHGPQNLCTGWIKEILKDKPHLALSFDVKSVDPVKQLSILKNQLENAGLTLKLKQDSYEYENL